MRRIRSVCQLVLIALMALTAPPEGGLAAAAGLTRQQALDATQQPAAAQRLAGTERLAEIGRAADAERLYPLLADADAAVRAAAEAALWRVWGRAGDPAIDKLYARGVAQMQAGAYEEALATFDRIVRRKPAFTEGWNKRATVFFLLGRHDESLHDCGQVLKRNQRHFGALSGAGQIHLQLGHPELALDFFRRALEVNPNLEGLAQIIPALERAVSERGRRTT